MFRRPERGLEVLLVHPGGPFFARKDSSAWRIPKGEAAPGEDLLRRARIEFEEELGIAAEGEFVSLGNVRQKGGKICRSQKAAKQSFSGLPLSVLPAVALPSFPFY